MKFYEAAPNIAMTNHLISASSVSINDKKFMSLPKDLQDILVASAKGGRGPLYPIGCRGHG